jgi:hypothetical protein
MLMLLVLNVLAALLAQSSQCASFSIEPITNGCGCGNNPNGMANGGAITF